MRQQDQTSAEQILFWSWFGDAVEVAANFFQIQLVLSALISRHPSNQFAALGLGLRKKICSELTTVLKKRMSGRAKELGLNMEPEEAF